MDNKLSEFLLVSEFGCKESVLIDDKKAIKVCADRAYLDLCRTLRYKKTIGDCERKKFKKKSIDMIIIEGCENLYKKNIKEEYDETHQMLCEKLCKMYNEADIFDAGHIFSYGQAQKWVNMTMKYFVLMKYESSNGSLLSIMHIPVDNYVLEAFESEKSFPQEMKNEYKEKPWSKWDEDTYLSFINNLRELVEAKKTDYDTCFEWEYNIWNNKGNKPK